MRLASDREIRMRFRPCILAILAALLANPTAAQTVSDFYKSKPVRFIIGYNPGGGFDAYGRALARFIGPHIPGQPEVIVINMPGAGSLKGVQYLLNQAPKDGSEFGIFNDGLISKSIMTPEKVGVDFRKLTLIGKMSSDTDGCFSWRQNGITNASELRNKKNFSLGATLGSGINYVFAALFPENVKMITGYPGTAEIWLALERGELDGYCSGFSSTKINKNHWITENKIAPIVQFAMKPSEDPFFKGVPLAQEVAATEGMKSSVLFLTEVGSLARPIAGPPGMPADRTKALRDAFMATFQDANFIENAEKTRMVMGPMSGEELTAVLERLYQTPKETLEMTKQIVPEE